MPLTINKFLSSCLTDGVSTAICKQYANKEPIKRKAGRKQNRASQMACWGKEYKGEIQTSYMDKEVLWLAYGDAHGREECFYDRWHRLGSMLGWWRSIWYSVDGLIYKCQAQSEV